MPRKKPPSRIVVQRSRNNVKRRLVSVLPALESRLALAECVRYGAYSKHKYKPDAYGLAPYAGMDVDRTYCDAHASFGKESASRIPALLRRAVMLGLWSEQHVGEVPSLLWTVDESGWVFELRMTNVAQAQYHGYPLLSGDAFAKRVLARVAEVCRAQENPAAQDPDLRAAIVAAETFYR